MSKLTPFNTYPGAGSGWLYPTSKQIEEVCHDMQPLEEWRTEYARNAHKAGSHQTVGNHIGLTAMPIAGKRKGKQSFSWSQWLAMCLIAKVEINIPAIDLYISGKKM